MSYIRVAETENDEAIELPLEDDNTLLFSTLAGQFPGVSSLNYRNPDTNSLRGLKLVEKKLHPPEGGFKDLVYFCVFPKDNNNKRKSDDLSEQSNEKSNSVKLRKLEQKCSDLIVLGLPWETRDETLKEYFEQYGEVVMAQVKMNANGEKSKGFGFIRYSSYADQIRVLSQRHRIDGRWCDVKIPDSKVDSQKYGSYRDGSYSNPVEHQPYASCKIFVGRCTDDMKVEDLKEYFSKFGEVNDVFIPKPFRAFAFVTFQDSVVAQSLIGEDHIIKGHSVIVTSATPKGAASRNAHRNSGGGQRDGPMSNSMHNQNMGRNQGGPMQQNDPPVGMGQFNLGSIPLDSAIVTAALSQAGFGRSVLNNLQHGGGGGGGYGNSNYGGGGGGGSGFGGGPGNYGNSGGNYSPCNSGPQDSYSHQGYGHNGGGLNQNQGSNWNFQRDQQGGGRDQPGGGNRNPGYTYYRRY